MFSLERKISKLELSIVKLKAMPGFKFKWLYNNDVQPDPDFVQTPVTAEFVKLVNFVSKTLGDEQESIWKPLRQLRMDYVSQAELTWLPGRCDFYKAFTSAETIQLNIEKLLKIKDVSKSTGDNMDKSTFKMAAEMFIFLNFCPDELFQSPWIKFYRDLIQNQPPKEIILALNRLLKTISTENKSLFQIPRKLLTKLLTMLDLQYENLYSLSNHLARKKEPGNFLTYDKNDTNTSLTTAII